MPPTTVTNVSNLTKETIADLYFASLKTPEMRESHSLIYPGGANRVPSPSTHDVGLDFKGWYGGLQSLAQSIDPGCALPGLKEMAGYINQNFDRAKDAIAA
jgi:hypothetical protein